MVRFGLNCTVVENRTLTVYCEGIYGVINKSEVTCVYESGQIQEKCRYTAERAYMQLIMTHIEVCISMV